MEISAIRQFFDNVRVFWLITSMVDLCNPLPRYLKVCAARYWGIGVLMLGGGPQNGCKVSLMVPGGGWICGCCSIPFQAVSSALGGGLRDAAWVADFLVQIPVFSHVPVCPLDIIALVLSKVPGSLQIKGAQQELLLL